MSLYERLKQPRLTILPFLFERNGRSSAFQLRRNIIDPVYEETRSENLTVAQFITILPVVRARMQIHKLNNRLMG